MNAIERIGVLKTLLGYVSDSRWEMLVSELRKSEAAALADLTTKNLDPHRLGYMQGQLAIVRNVLLLPRILAVELKNIEHQQSALREEREQARIEDLALNPMEGVQ